MQFLAVFAGLAAIACAAPQGVTQDISPQAAPPPGCQTSYSAGFSITTINATTSGQKVKRQASNLVLHLNNGKLLDQDGDTGYIASNFQFQFDKPPQTGAIYTAGFSVCPNNSLALGGSAVFYSCNSGSFNNLYDRSWAAQCSPVYIEALPQGGGVSTPSASATKAPDGQPAQSTALRSAPGSSVTQISDKQPQAATTAASAVTQISDKQPQAGTTAASAGVSQISDKQPQAGTTAASAGVSQISDKQPQAGTTAASAVVSQISDKQPQAPTGVSQISDKQIQAPTGVSQISDKQIQAPATPSASPVSKISDNQPQAPTSAATASRSPVSYTGGAALPTAAPMAMAAGALIAALL